MNKKKLLLDYDYYTQIGGRKINQDAITAIDKNCVYLFALADGLGGHLDGEIASKTTVDVLVDAFRRENGAFDIVDKIQYANKKILDLQLQAHTNMKSTISVVRINESVVECHHVGDTRIYLFDDNDIVYQSVDHSVSYLSVIAGEIKKEEIRLHNDRNILTRVLGSDLSLKVDSFFKLKKEVKACLICTDGFWEYVYEHEMIETLKKSKSAHDWLWSMRKILKLRSKNCGDNNSAIVVKLGGDGNEIL